MLIIVLIIIAGSIFYFESTKPKVDNTAVNADIQIEGLENNNPSNIGNLSDFGGVVLTQKDLERIELKSEKYERAKELVEPDGYINVDNITIAENIGKKIILVDFWTYSCINCQRTLPYITAWYEKYKDAGLVIIGVHTPEFEFEKDYDNVVMATHKWNITYPVVQDNDYKTWKAYNNRYWPRKYIIDIDGFIVYDHIGEGAYDETEKVIQDLLEERSDVLGLEQEVDTGIVSIESGKETIVANTPEIYFGYDFSREQFGNSKGWKPEETVTYVSPENKERDLFYLDGTWKNNKDNMELVGSDGMISLEYYAREVNLVAGSENPVAIEVYLDGKKTKDVTVHEFDLYNLISSEETGEHLVEIKTEKGLIVYTFTFG